ncbi:MAG TPA: methionine--tRNA ligase [Planctomycetota bacterium]
MAKYFITTAIDYVNSVPHVGTSYEKILADAQARWRRLKGDDVFFLMGNDEHSQNVADKAASLGLEPRAYCDQMEGKFKATWAKLSISFDRFIRTTEPAHYAACQEIFKRLQAKGDIKKALWTGLYCVGCEARKTEKEIVEGKCPNHPGQPLRPVNEENYFFLLSKYADPIRKLLQTEGFVNPSFRAKELLSVVEEGLEDISISRRTTRWGVPIPGDPEQVMYVWFDALINYITAAGFPGDVSKWWPADCHVVGKDITRFHCVIWPAMLMAAGLDVPKNVAAHGFIYIDGRKASKSSDDDKILKDPIALADKIGADALRYFLLREAAFGQDGDITWEKLVLRCNGDLGKNLGNLLSRIVKMATLYFEGAFASKGVALPGDAALNEKMNGLVDRVAPMMDRFDFHMALAEIFEASSAINAFIENTAPFRIIKEGKTEEVAGCLYRAAEALRVIGILVAPFVPGMSEKIFEQLGIAEMPRTLDVAREREYIKAGTRVRPGPVLFQVINAKQP